MNRRTVEVLHVLLIHVAVRIDVGVQEGVCVVIRCDDRRLVIIVTKVFAVRLGPVLAVVGIFFAAVCRIKTYLRKRTR